MNDMNSYLNPFPQTMKSSNTSTFSNDTEGNQG